MALHLTKTVVGTASVLVGALFMTGCGAGAAETPSPSSATTSGAASADAPTSVSIESNLGTVEVPVNPARVVALDNTSFETLRDWGITPVAVPKGLLPGTGFEDWLADESILDIGNHREPNLELVSEADPDLIIGGYRFASVQEDLESIAQTIDIAGSDEAAGGYVDSLKTQTVSLGEIFQKQDEAAEVVAALETATADAAAATNGETVFLSVVNGGKIDNGAERIGRILEPLTLTDVFAGKDGDIHGDSGLAPETIAQANPDWMIVLDRDAGAKTAGAQPAKAVIDATEAFAETTFAQQGQIIYLDPQFYTREGIQAYTQAFDQVTAAFSA